MKVIHHALYYCCLSTVIANSAIAETYSFTAAKTYAVNNYNVPYNSTTGNLFPNFGTSGGGNCTNFASQSILAGLTGKTSPSEVFLKRYNFAIDRNDTQNWYLVCNEPKAGSRSTDCRSFSWGLLTT